MKIYMSALLVITLASLFCHPFFAYYVSRKQEFEVLPRFFKASQTRPVLH